MLHKHILIWFASCGLLIGSATAETTREHIQREYNKTSTSLNLHFVDPIFARRTGDFRALDHLGRPIPLGKEREQFRTLFFYALDVKDEVRILDFQANGKDRATVSTIETLELLLLDPITQEPRLLRIASRNDDEWVSTPRGWRLRQTRVLRQEVQRPLQGAR